MDAVRLVFERGEFDYNSSVMVFDALLYLSVSILPYVFRDSITRVYYAYDDAKTPFVVATSSIVLKVIFNYLFINVMGMQIGGITLSTSLVTLYNAVGLGLLMSRKIKLDYKELFINLAKMIFVGGISLVVSYLTAKILGLVLADSMTRVVFEMFRIALVSMVLAVTYIVLSLAFKVDYVDELKERIMSKLSK